MDNYVIILSPVLVQLSCFSFIKRVVCLWLFNDTYLIGRWEEHGVEALLFDDGLEHDDDVTYVKKRHVGLTELTDALLDKYDLLRKKLFWFMLEQSQG